MKYFRTPLSTTPNINYFLITQSKSFKMFSIFFLINLLPTYLFPGIWYASWSQRTYLYIVYMQWSVTHKVETEVALVEFMLRLSFPIILMTTYKWKFFWPTLAWIFLIWHASCSTGCSVILFNFAFSYHLAVAFVSF